jgi:hypothetical protein
MPEAAALWRVTKLRRAPKGGDLAAFWKTLQTCWHGRVDDLALRGLIWTATRVHMSPRGLPGCRAHPGRAPEIPVVGLKPRRHAKDARALMTAPGC